MRGDLPVPALMDGAFRFGALRSFLGRIVSLLGLSLKLPSTRLEDDLSVLPMADWATDGTVSVSTVMLRDGCVAERVDREDSDGFVVTWWGRCADAERCCSCILAVWVFLVVVSLPLPFCLALCLELRSSVTLAELTSFRSSSETLGAVAIETKLDSR